VYARSLFHILCSANGFMPPSCPLTKSYTPSFTRRRINGGVQYAIRLLRQVPTASNIARIAGKEYSADKPPSASGSKGKCHAIAAKKPLYNVVFSACF